MSDRALRIAKALIDARKASPPPPDRLQRPATVVSYDPSTNVAVVTVAGDTGTIEMVSLAGAVVADQRVMMSFESPRGAFITHAP